MLRQTDTGCRYDPQNALPVQAERRRHEDVRAVSAILRSLEFTATVDDVEDVDVEDPELFL
jgi:hypothetical protein